MLSHRNIIGQGDLGDISEVVAGSGLTGGSSSGVATINVGAGTGVIVTADAVAIGQDVATTASPTFASLTLTQPLFIQSGTDYSTTGSQNNVSLANASLVRYTGAGTATFTGIIGGTNGEIITLMNASSSSLTLTNEDVLSTAANRIITGIGASLSIDGGASLTIQYDSTSSRWRVIGLFGAGSGTGITVLNGLNASTQTFVNDTNVTITSSGSAHTIGFAGQLSLARGGSNASLTASAGAVAYSTASALALSAVGTIDQILASAGAGTPVWQNIVSRLTAGTNITISGTTNATLGTIANPSFSTSVTTPLITNAGSLTLQTTATAGADDIIFTAGGTERMRVLENGDLFFEKGLNDVTITVTAPSAARTYTLPDLGSNDTLAGIAATQTLTNKTVNLTSNTLTGTTAQFNTALSDNDFATLAGTETLTNKTVNLTSNTLIGTTAQFNTALSDNDFATLAGTETLTNKTLTSPTINTPTLTVNDNSLTIRDDLDTTKQLNLQLSGITTATTRTLTIPDANTTIVGTDATQTLTNKTIGGPFSVAGITQITDDGASPDTLSYASFGVTRANVGTNNAYIGLTKQGIIPWGIGIDSGSSLIFGIASSSPARTIPTSLVTITNTGNVGIGIGTPDQTLDVRGEISIFGSSASLSRIRFRGFYTDSPANPPTDQSDIMIIDTGTATLFRVRYNDAGVMKVGDLALV